MQIGRSFSSNSAGDASFNRNRIDDGGILVFLAVIANGEHTAIERKYMVVVVICGKSSVDRHRVRRCFLCKIETVQPAIAVVDQRPAISGPIWLLTRIRRLIENV